MDFSSHNPITSNVLNLASRNDDIKTVRKLLKTINPNCIDNRGWTCLHEAAYNDSYESLLAILQHPDCRPLSETHEGHTALYLACRNNCSIRTIKALLENVEDIANYGSTEGVTPLHVASSQGRVDLIQLLIEYGALLDVQDFDGDTPLHDAVLAKEYNVVAALLHAGANPEIKNEPGCYTPFHLACCKDCYETVEILFPFVTDFNQVTTAGHSPLMLALNGTNEDIIDLLLQNGADPHLKDCNGDMAIDVVLTNGSETFMKKIFSVTDQDKISRSIVLRACKPHYFKLKILEILLASDLGPEFFDFFETFYIKLEQIGEFRPSYRTNAPLNSYLNICEYIYDTCVEKFREFFYLFLMRNVRVNANDVHECPPLVYIHYCLHINSFEEAFKILIEQGCDVDYCTAIMCLDKARCIPDAFIAALTSDTSTIPIMIPYSLHCDPGTLLQFAYENGVLSRIPPNVQDNLLTMIGSYEGLRAESLAYTVPSLKHLCRCKFRSALRNRKGGVKSTTAFLRIINNLPIPQIIKDYLRYVQ